MMALADRRVTLIDRKFKGKLSPVEEAELDTLQAEHGAYLDAIQPPPFDKLEELETTIIQRTMMNTLLGGYRIEHEFASGQMAIDWQRRRLYMLGHPYSQRVLVFDLPQWSGEGPNVMRWPVLGQVDELAPWWPLSSPSAAGVYCNGLWVDPADGTPWAVTRCHYETDPKPTMRIYGPGGDSWDVPLAQQRFSGFVKTPGNQEIYYGCGGYESGIGTCSGPTLATADGQVLLEYDWLDEPGANLENWNTRAQREPDYQPDRDSWLGWMPRVVGEQLQGRWASDWLWGGGIYLPGKGLYYWPYMGTGKLQYRWFDDPDYPDGVQRAITFARQPWLNVTRQYRYDLDAVVDAQPRALAMPFLGWADMGFAGPIRGQDVDPLGRIWLAQSEAWGPGDDQSHAVIRVYEIQ